MEQRQNQYDIVVVDSGNNLDPEQGITIVDVAGAIQIRHGCSDTVYHGTAINYIIKKNFEIGTIFNIALCSNDMDLSIEHLNAALSYIKKNIRASIILICLGFTKNSSQLENTESLIGDLLKQGMSVISAFDNRGFVSYPAAFRNVIGVEESSSIDCPNGEYVTYLNSIVNVCFPRRYYRTVWNKEPALLHGNSFAAAELASIVMRSLYHQNHVSTKTIWYQIYQKSYKTISLSKDSASSYSSEGKHFVEQIQKAIIFPVNKETIVLDMFSELVKFDIVEWYDTKYSGRCGKALSAIIPNSTNMKTVKCVNDIKWEGDFDTIILGHIDEIEKITGINYQEIILRYASNYGKKVYGYDPIKGYPNANCWYPRIDKLDVVKKTGKHLYQIDTLVVAIVGTSSMQGKYTLQLKLKQMFQKKRYKVCHLSTEPTGYLLGADFVYPVGHNSENDHSFYESVNCINFALADMEISKNPDVIIAGSQAGSIPYAVCTYDNLLPKQHALLTGLNPTAVVLCVNTFDDLDYIKRTVYYILSQNSDLIGIAFLPRRNSDSFTKRFIEMTDSEIQSFKTKIKSMFLCNVFNITNNEDVLELCNEIISKYSGSE